MYLVCRLLLEKKKKHKIKQKLLKDAQIDTTLHHTQTLYTLK